MVQALELLYALGGKPVFRVFTYVVIVIGIKLAFLESLRMGLVLPMCIINSLVTLTLFK